MWLPVVFMLHKLGLLSTRAQTVIHNPTPAMKPCERRPRRLLRALVMAMGGHLLMLSCSTNTGRIPEDQVLARVGDEIITVRDFRLNYEFGFGHLKRGQDRKKAYLDLMIKERVLALEGYRLSLDKSERVRKQEERLLKELLIEALMEEKVRSKIRVTEDDIRDAINKSKVSFKLRYWFEPTLDDARRTVEAMTVRGYADVVGEKLRDNPEVKIDPAKFETGYITYLELEPALLEEIKDLPIGAISNPIELDGQYGIFQMLDIRRAGVLESEYKSKATSFEQIVFYQKYQKAVAGYIEGVMTSKDVVAKADAFRLLGKAILEWHKPNGSEHRGFNESVERATPSQPAMYALKMNFEKTFMTSREENLTIREFLDHFDVNSIKTLDKSDKPFIERLNDAVALSIRDYFLAKEARSQGLGETAKVKKELGQWRDKWVYQEARAQFTEGIELQDSQIHAFFEEHKSRYKIRKDDQPTFAEFSSLARRDAYRHKAQSILDSRINSLRSRYPVSINYATLDTLTVIDFKKSRWATIQVLKSGTNRRAVPVVDPAWTVISSSADSPK